MAVAGEGLAENGRRHWSGLPPSRVKNPQSKSQWENARASAVRPALVMFSSRLDGNRSIQRALTKFETGTHPFRLGRRNIFGGIYLYLDGNTTLRASPTGPGSPCSTRGLNGRVICPHPNCDVRIAKLNSSGCEP